MLQENEFNTEWTEIGIEVAGGCYLNKSHLLAIFDNLDLRNIKPEYLPDEKTVLGKPSERKWAIFILAQKLWGLSSEDWLAKESNWLKEARADSGSKTTEGKDNFDDVISAEIMIRLLATAKVVGENKDDDIIVEEAINALNLFIGEVCAKGRTRMVFRDNSSIYGKLREAGITIGFAGSKFLPYPQKSLVELLLMLRKDRINTEAYLS